MPCASFYSKDTAVGIFVSKEDENEDEEDGGTIWVARPDKVDKSLEALF
jgi:hypothetical protein